ncbi:MAG: hypothetical protein WC699_03575 [Bacteroidales bacterium]|jgi:hypothetical protein
MDFLNNIFCFNSSNFWSALSAIFTGIAALAIILARKQLRFDSWLQAQSLFTEETFLIARKEVYSLKGRDFKLWNDKEKEYAMLVCRKMDQLAHLVPFLGKKRVLKTWDNPLAQSWMILKNFVINERGPNEANWLEKWIAFEKIGEEAVKRIKK